MVDYFFEINESAKQTEIRDYENIKMAVTYNYDEKTGALQLTFANKSNWIIQSKELNRKALPAAQDGMHYTIDEIK
jgi:frataxin-like iron-binding protein CyaY